MLFPASSTVARISQAPSEIETWIDLLQAHWPLFLIRTLGSVAHDHGNLPVASSNLRSLSLLDRINERLRRLNCSALWSRAWDWQQ
jgi:hypothetical protein